MRWFCGLCLCVLMLAAGQRAAVAERRVALVVGNGGYGHATPLANPVNDARDMAEALSDAQFEVILGTDLTKAGLQQTIREFARKIEAADVALFYYAGHGLQVGGVNYLVPVDAQLQSERDLEFEATRLELLLGQMELGREGKTTLVFLDACRDNPLLGNLARSMGTRSAALGRGLAQVKSGVGTFISFSTQPGNVAVDGDGRNSPFTAALKTHIRGRGVSLSDTMINVRRDVIGATSGKQVPWDHSALTGRFFFHPPVTPVSAGNSAAGAGRPAAPPTTEVAALEKRLKDLEAALRRGANEGAQSDATADQARKADLEYRISDLERQQRADQSKVFEINRKFTAERDGRARLDLSRERHQVSIAMIARGKEISRLKAELAALTAPAKAEGEGECRLLRRQGSERIALSSGLRICSDQNDDFAEVVRIANRAVAFRVNGGREFTCRTGDTCQFDWLASPLFSITATADAARGIAPVGTLIPQ